MHFKKVRGFYVNIAHSQAVIFVHHTRFYTKNAAKSTVFGIKYHAKNYKTVTNVIIVW